MERLSLNNHFRNISYRQFLDITAQFHEAAQKAFGTRCTLKISLFKHLRKSCNIPPEGKWSESLMARENRDATFLESSDIAEITEKLWHQARQVVVRIEPVDETAGPAYAFGEIDFKGRLPQRATFYIQGGDHCDIAIRHMRAAYPFMRKGDGYFSYHGIRSFHGA